MYEKFEPQDETDRKLMKDVERSDGRIKLTEKLQCVPAEKEDVDRIMEIVDYARRSLRVLNVDQWQGDYPDRATFEGDIERGELYKLMHGGDLAGFFMLSDREEPTYADITDGKWSSDAPYCVMHRSAIAEEYRGNGMSGYLIKRVEELTRSHGRRYVSDRTRTATISPCRSCCAAAATVTGEISSSPASRDTTRTGRPLKKY